jgi:glycosyltransferase involved in cell wall biosynthesis
MKILYFIDSLIAGGKERRLTELMKAISLRPNISFELVVMKKEIHYKEVLGLNIKIHYLIRKTKKDVSPFQKFYKICKTYKPDIVHCWDSMTATYSIPACKLLNIKLVNGMVIDTPVTRNFQNKHWLRAKLTFPFSTIIIGNSKAGLKAYNAPEKKSICVYNGMDLARFDKLKSSSLIREEIFGLEAQDLFIAGMVAAFEDRKDYRTLIRAAILLLSKNDNVRFVLIGDGAEFAEIKNSVPALLQEKIIFLGKRSDVESIANIFDVGILLTNSKVHGEGISNSIIEYMALGKPVIATRGGGTDEAVMDNQNGYLIDPDREDQLVEKLELFIKQRKQMTELGKKGNQIVREKFDLKIMANNYVSVYDKLLKEKIQ